MTNQFAFFAKSAIFVKIAIIAKIATLQTRDHFSIQFELLSLSLFFAIQICHFRQNHHSLLRGHFWPTIWMCISGHKWNFQSTLCVLRLVAPLERPHFTFRRDMASWLVLKTVQRGMSRSSCWHMRSTRLWRVWWHFRLVLMTSSSFTTGYKKNSSLWRQ